MNWNSIGAYTGATAEDLSEAAGITQFPDEHSFYQILNGLQIQGGLTASIPIAGTLIVPFHAAYETQVLGIFLQPVNATASYGAIDPAGSDLTQLTIVNGPVAGPYYWWAVGV